MVDRNESLPEVIPVHQEIQVRGKKDLSKDKHDRNKDGKKHSDKNEKPEYKTPETIYYGESAELELGNLLIKRKNYEVEVYHKLHKKENAPEDEVIILDSEISQLRVKIQLIDKEFENYHNTPSNSNSENDLIGLKYLSDLLIYYKRYSTLSDNEYKIIDDEDFDLLPDIMSKKNETLSKIETTLNKVNFSYITKLEPVNKKRIKAESILSDIKFVINGIIEKEGKNSVELQSQKKDLQYKLNKRNSSLKALKGYSRTSRRPHFVNTSK